MKGVPVRIEIGPRDIENGVATVARRDKTEEKFTIRLDDIATELPKLLADIQTNMYNKALAFRDSHVKIVSDTAELKDAVDSGNFALGMWCGDRECEDKIKEVTGASTRNMPFDQTPCGDNAFAAAKKLQKRFISEKRINNHSVRFSAQPGNRTFYMQKTDASKILTSVFTFYLFLCVTKSLYRMAIIDTKFPGSKRSTVSQHIA